MHLSFSGFPDRDMLRDNEFSQNNPDTVKIRNMVTQDKLNHYFKYMDEKNISNYKKIYIVA